MPLSIYNLKYIETLRLIIRPARLGDEYALSEAIQATLEDLQRWMSWSKNSSFATTEAFVKKAHKAWRAENSEDYPMVVEYKQNNKIICATGFNEQSQPDKGLYEIGYWLHKDYQGMGLVCEYVNALTRFAIEALYAKQVLICTQTENVKSIAVAKRCGFKLERVMPEHRIDCLTGNPADSSLFMCDELNQLPKLDVSWVQEQSAMSKDSFFGFGYSDSIVRIVLYALFLTGFIDEARQYLAG